MSKEYFNNWYDGILNRWPFLQKDGKVKSLGIAWLFTVNGKWRFLPKPVPMDWQYANAIFFIRFNLWIIPFLFMMWVFFQLVSGWWLLAFPFWYLASFPIFGFIPYSLFIHFRGKIHLQQMGIGWKQNGRYAIHFRHQTDESSAQGYHAGLPNTDHASGFDYGRH